MTNKHLELRNLTLHSCLANNKAVHVATCISIYSKALIMINATASSLNPLTTDALHALRSDGDTSKKPMIRFTVKAEDYSDAVDFFKDAANWNRVNVKLESEDIANNDYGGGQGSYTTVTFSFIPDQADGTFSSSYQEKIKSAERMFQGRMNSAGIRNYAPEE